MGISHKWRLSLLFAVLIATVPLLGVRLAMLLSEGQERAQKLVQRQHRKVVVEPARPGNIFGRSRHRYILLAGSKQVPSCYADPSLLRDPGLRCETAARLSAVLGMPVEQILEILASRDDSQFVWLKRGISGEEEKAVGELRINAVGVTYEWRREYPNGSLAASVVGFRLRDNNPGGGLELSQDAYLAARDGKTVLLADALRRPIRAIPDQSIPPQDGNHVFLTLDPVIQGYLEQAVGESVEKFSAKWGVGVVVNPQTGEILAMCSVPSFDPNNFTQADPPNRTNRAMTVPYEPGSVFKPLMAAMVVDAGLMDYQTQIFCENGTYHASRGGRISDHGNSYGWLSLTDVVVHSSNIGMAKVGEKLGNQAMYSALKKYGFGERTGIDLPGESPGIVRDMHKWDGYSMRRVPFGQEISATTVQLTMAFSALANRGLLMQPRLVDMVTDANGQVVYRLGPKVVRRVVSPESAAATLAVMRQVVERGTGTNCKIEGYSVFGKTGTAQIPGPSGYEQGAYIGSFVGGAPVNDPRLVCMISIYWPQRSKGYYGSTVAAPYVKQVLDRTLRYLNVPPNQQDGTANRPADLEANQGERLD